MLDLPSVLEKRPIKFFRGRLLLAQLAVFLICFAIAGCGGGYAGGVVPSLASSKITIDGGQTFMAVATNPANLPLTWSLSGTGCSGQTCGTLTDGSALGVTYVAPTVTQPITVTLTSTVTGTPTTSSTTIVVNPDPQITGSAPDATVGTAYSATFALTGGTPTLKWLPVKGTLPAGLSFNTTTGIISGTPTAAGTSTFTLQAVDSSDVPFTVTSTITLKVNTGATNSSLKASGTTPDGTVNVAYSSVLQASGGTSPYTWSITSGTLPAGLNLSATGIISGTPTAAGTSTFTAQVQDAAGATSTLNLTLKINAASTGATLSIATSTLPSGTVQVPYAASITITGGTGPYSCTVDSGSLPAGLTLGSNCAVTGIPTTAGTSTFNVKATDSGSPSGSGTGLITIVINPAPAVLVIASPPTATIGVPYSGAVSVTGGTAPYHCVLASGAMPAGLTLGADCVINGTPLVAGTTSIGVTATDSANPANTTTATVTVTVQAPLITLTITAPPAAIVNVPYVGAILVAGGTAPYQCSVVSGAMPNGLTLNSDCTITGTPQTPGIFTVGVTATDSANPANTKTDTVHIAVLGSLVTLTITAPPVGVVGVPYVGGITVLGGVAPYTCTVASGTLPTGLTLGSNCIITGTPQTPGTFSVGITATDSASPANTQTSPVTITILGNLVTLTLTAPPVAVVNVPYVGLITVLGGIAPYNCSLASGALPAGLTLNSNCVITGTPTTPGVSSVTITATDSANPANTTTAPVTITVQGNLITLTLTAPPVGIVNVPYVGGILVVGGTAPYTCSVASGTLPPGLTLNSNCSITGTPTSAGPFSVGVNVHDSASPVNSTTTAVPITILGATSTLVLTGPPNATANTPYTGAIGVTGGTAPYTCVINSGSLPAGLTMAANCSITGTPTTPGTSTFNVTATDSGSPAKTGTATVALTVNPINGLSLTGGLPNATLGVPYTQTLTATGGLPPYTYTLTGSLPAGLSLSTAGVVSGTPTAVGASSFTVTATDSQSTPQQASLPLTMQVVYPTTPSDALLKGPYAFLFQGYDDVALGVLAYQTATIGSITADGNGLLTAGELDSNHQASNPTGNTISTSNLLGTYTIGTDGRGTLAVTTLNTDGTAGNTTTYALALKLPTAPATASSSGSMIESDGDILIASKGSGTLLAQNANVYGNGLNGGYAYGVSGDTPCIPTCTIGLIAGPVASVGQFTATSGTIAGVSDTNIASTNYASSTLAGTSSAADTNGRVALTLTSQKLSGLAYPTHYAVYLVDQTHAFIMSTDKHSSYVLQAGTIQSQSQTTFSNASLNGPFVGYENAAINPGIIGKTLDSVLNLSSANVIRGTGNNNGTCTTTNADSAGLTGLVNTLTGLGGDSGLLNYVLGTYQSTGNSACAVASNGRVVFNYPAPDPSLLTPVLQLLGLTGNPPPPRVVYLTGNNQGYFLETGYAGLGHLEAQAAGPFTLANLNGTYTYGTVPASSLATIDGDGAFTADGAGNLTYTTDTNIGVGNLNILQLGISGSSTYSLTDAAGGRYLLSDGSVVYALSPGRFVVLKGGSLSTAPYTAILY